jgi:hypothetical protein
VSGSKSGSRFAVPERAALVRGGAVAVVALVCLVVAAVGAVAVVAELNETWGWYFLMERTITFGTPIALALVGLSVVACFGLVVLSPSD